MEEYLERRKELVKLDRSLRVDYRRTFEDDDVRMRAAKIVSKIEQAENRRIWEQHHDGVAHAFPGMEFLTGKAIILKTKLFEILTKMPKGALLHAHLDAMVNARSLLDLALKQPAFHIRVPEIITAKSLNTILPQFRALPPDEIAEVSAGTLTGPSYNRNAWVPLSAARENFDRDLGGQEGFDAWVIGTLTINPKEAYETHNTVDKIWDKFQSIFAVSDGLVRYFAIWDQYIREFFLHSIEDGISYVEPRINFVYKTMVGLDGQDNVPHREWVVAFERVLHEVKAHMTALGRGNEFVGARIIYTTVRFVTPEELEWYLEDCIALKQEFPHMIAGFDLVGYENVLRPLIDYIEPLLRFQQRQKELNLDIPFIFHAGETLGDGSKADMNLYDAILLGTKRIGHGHSLAKHPKLIEICREKGIAVEVCPISNEILRLTSSMPMHPLPVLMNQGVPVALCSDDPAIFGNMGLTFDFYQVMVASDVTNLLTLGEMARDSLKYSTLEDDDKAKAISLWENRWYKFCEEIVATDFGNLLEDAS